jgi:hypothetical protein
MNPIRELFSSAIEKARADVTRIHQLEQKLSASYKSDVARLAELRTGAGSRIVAADLDGGDVDAVTTNEASAVSQLAAKLAATRQAIDAARARRPAAIQHVWAMQAAEIRQEAAKKRAEADELQGKVDPLLAELRRLTDVDYVPLPPPTRLNAGEMVKYVVPAMQWRRMEASELDAHAAELESRKVPESGSISGSSLDELLAQVRSDSMRIAPVEHEIEGWAKAAEQQARERWKHTTPRPYGHYVPIDSVAFTLIWRAGKIVTGESFARAIGANPELIILNPDLQPAA